MRTVPTPGMVLADNFRLEFEIGRGGMGSVWRAKRLDLDADVAVKVLHVEASQRADLLGRFSREAKATASLSSPHVIRIIDFGVDGATEHAFLVMELLQGETLRQRMTRERPLPAPVLARVLTQVGRALEQAHSLGIVHRDIKPGNIFLVENADEELVKLLDFGIAKAEEAPDDLLLTQTGNVLGTPQYMSPEQLTSSKAVDHRSDLWSLAVIAYECLVGRRPFRGASAAELAMKISLGRSEPPSSVAPVPPGFDEWFARATEVDPERRFQSAKELAQAFTRLVLAAPQPAPASEITTVPRAAPTVGFELVPYAAAVAPAATAGAVAGAASTPTLDEAPLTDAALVTSNTNSGVSRAVAARAAVPPQRRSWRRWGLMGVGAAAAAVLSVRVGALLQPVPELGKSTSVVAPLGVAPLGAAPLAPAAAAVQGSQPSPAEQAAVRGLPAPALSGAAQPRAALAEPDASAALVARPAVLAGRVNAALEGGAGSARGDRRVVFGGKPSRKAKPADARSSKRQKQSASPPAPTEAARPARKRNPLDAYDMQ